MCVATSFTEADYVAVSDAAKEPKFVRESMKSLEPHQAGCALWFLGKIREHPDW